jgi:hypothetical protein
MACAVSMVVGRGRDYGSRDIIREGSARPAPRCSSGESDCHQVARVEFNWMHTAKLSQNLTKTSDKRGASFQRSKHQVPMRSYGVSGLYVSSIFYNYRKVSVKVLVDSSIAISWPAIGRCCCFCSGGIKNSFGDIGVVLSCRIKFGRLFVFCWLWCVLPSLWVRQ